MKAERKYLAHFIDAAFDTSYKDTNYVRLGKDLTELNVELNPQVETSRNINGENSVKHDGYEASANAAPVYYEYSDTLTEKVMEIAMLRKTGDACRTSYVEVLMKPGETADTAPTVIRAIREDILLIPTSYGGDNSGVQIPFSINFAGNRTEGTFDISTKTFTANA